MRLKSSQYFLKLSLEACGLKEIEGHAFLPISSLKHLFLGRNALNAKMLEQGFYGLRFVKNMTTLDLQQIYLRDLSNSTFKFLINTSLHTVSMTTFEIHALASGIFLHFVKSSQVKT